MEQQHLSRIVNCGLCYTGIDYDNAQSFPERQGVKGISSFECSAYPVSQTQVRLNATGIG